MTFFIKISIVIIYGMESLSGNFILIREFLRFFVPYCSYDIPVSGIQPTTFVSLNCFNYLMFLILILLSLKNCYAVYLALNLYFLKISFSVLCQILKFLYLIFCLFIYCIVMNKADTVK